MAETLARDGHRVSVLSRSDPGRAIRSAPARLIVGDAADPETLDDALDGIEQVVWCAGGLMPPEAEADPGTDRDLTLTPLRNLIAAADRRRFAITYLSSGGTVYGDPGPAPVSEDFPPQPIGAYGRTKLIAEELLIRGAAEAGFRLRILRCANVYGPNQPSDRSQGAVAVFGDRISQGVPIDVFGDGDAFRDYVHVDDVVRATVALWSVDGPVVLNCGSGRPVTINGLIEALEISIGRRAQVNHLPSRDFDVEVIVLDLSRIQSLIPFAPVDLHTGLGLSVSLKD